MISEREPLSLGQLQERLNTLRENVQRVFLGHPDAVDLMLVGLLARGHVLVEDVPGVGKTVLSKAIAKSIDCKFSRIQLTPDMLPADVLGVSVFNSGSNDFEFKPGPVFANIVLADEINRTTPRTQSALLEAMSEEQVSIENHTYNLERPFMVIATQNPFEFEGTYYLPENQLDRFVIRVSVGYPPRDAERRILLERPGQTVLDDLQPVMTAADVVELQDATPRTRVDDAVMDYILDLIDATRHHDQLHLGVSPRGAQALIQAIRAYALVQGRDYVEPDDVKAMFLPACAHRVISKSYLQNGDAQATARILEGVLDTVAAPR
ncbi:MAG: MoxR family ATPase [Planctomycetota bacterium]